jgi:hypothetical protein
MSRPANVAANARTLRIIHLGSGLADIAQASLLRQVSDYLLLLLYVFLRPLLDLWTLRDQRGKRSSLF